MYNKPNAQEMIAWETVTVWCREQWWWRSAMKLVSGKAIDNVSHKGTAEFNIKIQQRFDIRLQ